MRRVQSGRRLRPHMQRTDCCDQPFHCNSSCARSLGLRCAPQCAPCGPPEDTADDWQQRLSNHIRAEREANQRPPARRGPRRERGQDARADAYVQVLPLRRDLQGLAYGHNAHSPCATRAWLATLAMGRSTDRAAGAAGAALPQVGGVSLCVPARRASPEDRSAERF